MKKLIYILLFLISFQGVAQFSDEQQQCAIKSTGETVQLTGTEFRLLRYFLLHPNQVLSKSRLIEKVYDFDSEKESNVIETYVKRLRQKMGKEIIETRRGDDLGKRALLQA